MTDSWLAKVDRVMSAFANRHKHTLQRLSRAAPSIFEIGVFHLLIRFYERKYKISCQPQHLIGGEYRYLTTPNGNPSNFSFIHFPAPQPFEMRQQVRVVSPHHDEVSLTPDLVVLPAGASVQAARLQGYAGGKRAFFSVSGADVIAVHECKSLRAFPELLASFVGMASVAHGWFARGATGNGAATSGHLAPTLFVGGAANYVTARMATALSKVYPLNVVTQLHRNATQLMGPKASPRTI